MKKLLLAVVVSATVALSGCSRVEPNYAGVLMENYGKSGQADFSTQKGMVITIMPGTKLYKVPLFEQRGSSDLIVLKSADNTKFTATPLYSFRIKEKDAVKVVFNNKQVDGNGEEFIAAMSDNILEPKLADIIREESRKYSTATLMKEGGNLKFEKGVEEIVAAEFDKRGLELLTFNSQIEFSKEVSERINDRNKVNTNVSVIDEQILEQRKLVELASIQAQRNRIISEGLTDQLLKQQFIAKWDGKTALYGDISDIIANGSGTK